MTSAQAQWFWALIVACAFVFALVLAGCPGLARLLFRHRLEGIRDDGVDAVLDGRLRRDDPVRTFLNVLELIAAHARWVTPARGVAMVSGLRDLGVDDPADLVSASRLAAGSCSNTAQSRWRQSSRCLSGQMSRQTTGPGRAPWRPC